MPKVTDSVKDTGEVGLFEFKLVAGKHIGKDLTAKPSKVKNKETGEMEDVYPDKTYKTGDTVVSDQDLGKIHGTTKFMPVQARRQGMRGKAEEFVPQAPQHGGVSFPGGQVVEGTQQTTGAGGRETVTGPEDEKFQTVSPSVAHNEKAELKLPPIDDSEDDDEGEGEETLEQKYGTLERLTKSELLEVAKEEGVKVNPNASKDDILKAVKASGK